MPLPSTPPKYSSWAELVSSIRKGETGWRPYALQSALTSAGHTLTADGSFGPATEAAVKAYQAKCDLTADGIAGARTQGALLEDLGHLVHARLPRVPDGLMRGFAEGEGANVLAATNWSVPGGVDCGPMQYRVFGPPYGLNALQRAFDPLAAMVLAGRQFIDRADDFLDSAWIARQRGAIELAKRAAVLAHNWPAGARDFATTGTCTRPSEPATWVAPGTRFPDGTLVRTRWEWCQFYALGGRHGEGAITKYVTSWT